jgi:hypothetical protein
VTAIDDNYKYCDVKKIKARLANAIFIKRGTTVKSVTGSPINAAASTKTSDAKTIAPMKGRALSSALERP